MSAAEESVPQAPPPVALRRAKAGEAVAFIDEVLREWRETDPEDRNQECINWPFLFTGDRPMLSIGGKRTKRVPVYICTQTRGAPDGRWVKFECENRLCCNPEHLTWQKAGGEWRQFAMGDGDGNPRPRLELLEPAPVLEMGPRLSARDAVRGRRLKRVEVSEVIECLGEGMTESETAKEFGVPVSEVRRAVRGLI